VLAVELFEGCIQWLFRSDGKGRCRADCA